MADIDNFKAELKALLEKHNASIYCKVEGDTHGVNFEMVVEIGKTDHRINYGTWLEAGDI